MLERLIVSIFNRLSIFFRPNVAKVESIEPSITLTEFRHKSLQKLYVLERGLCYHLVQLQLCFVKAKYLVLVPPVLKKSR